MTQIIALISGILFGLGLAISGMVDPEKVMGFLDITGNWQIDLAFVMGGALLVFVPGYFLIVKHQDKPILSKKFSLPSKTDIDKPLIVGAVLFGIGWGLAGLCPGPAIASLSYPTADLLYFVAAMLVGLLCAPIASKRQS
ncbi:DUF6691 family protein [Thalassotalea aquiviva]|uniref:DUF6691 family protein n=1 Tax=Thalassotalea aquiviva TaxID=3242415 RepID=UPI00352AD834